MGDARKTFGLFALLGAALAAPLLFARAEEPPSAAPAQGQAEAQAKPAQAEAQAKPAPATAKPAAAKPAAASETLHRIETEHYVAKVSSLNGGLRSFELKGDRYKAGDEPIDVVTTDKPAYLPMRATLQGVDLSSSPFEVQRLGPAALQLTWSGDGLRITRKMEGGQGPYQLWITTRIENLGDAGRTLRVGAQTHHYVPRTSEQAAIPLLPVRSPAMSNALCKHAEDVEREPHGSFEGQPMTFQPGVRWVGVENVYFLNAVAPEADPAESCSMLAEDRGRDADGEPLGSLFSVHMWHPELKLPAGQVKVYRHLAYLGPKTPEELAAAGRSLKEAIDTGFFTTIAESLTQLLRVIHDMVGNWGLAIILLTLLVKLALYPLTAKQMQSMARMKELKPEMDRINELYSDDREKKGAAMMELYRKEGVNPMAGCFPMLLQLPIWFSLYTSLSTNVELFHAPFALWWTDLSSPDPYFSLPLGLGLLMFVQQKMAPSAGADPVQQKMMMYMMPAMITSFMLFLPAGLCLYMFTNSVLSIAQQRLIERRLAAAGPRKAPADSVTDSSDSDSTEDSTSRGSKRARVRPTKAQRRSRRGK